MEKANYLFISERLGFRNWRESDKVPFSRMNQDAEVMKFFPNLLPQEDSFSMVDRMADHFNQNGYTFFAVETIANKELIGFIGLVNTKMDTFFTPCVEIGWRLKKSAWGKGYATEGANRCLEFAFNELKLDEIYSFTPKTNLPSENVMIKIGMTKEGEFDHPKVDTSHPLNLHVLYKIEP
jgi:ribosomal-protein-alanine N-acetyltransferase